VAQSRAATWHPVIGLLVCVKIYGMAGGRTRDLPSGQWTGRAGLTTRAMVVLINKWREFVFELKVSNRRGKGPGLSPSPRYYYTVHTTIAEG
jgi:hypothetical protein